VKYSRLFFIVVCFSFVFCSSVPAQRRTRRQPQAKESKPQQTTAQSSTTQPQKTGKQSQGNVGSIVKQVPAQTYKGLALRVIGVKRVGALWRDDETGTSITARNGYEYIVVRMEVKPQESNGEMYLEGFWLLDDRGTSYECKRGSITRFWNGVITFTIEFPFAVQKNPAPKFKTFKLESLSFDIEELDGPEPGSNLSAPLVEQPKTAKSVTAAGVDDKKAQESSGQSSKPAADDPAQVETLMVKIQQLISTGNDDEALRVLRELKTIEPTYAEAYYLEGTIQHRKGDQKAAINLLKTAVYWENKHIKAHILLSQIYSSMGECALARSYATTALNIDPHNQEAVELQKLVGTGKCSPERE
jgi:tetratricopeptide repeat protein